MFKKKYLKKFLCGLILGTQCFPIMPVGQALAYDSFGGANYETSKNKQSIQIFSYMDNEDLKAKIIQDKDFISHWANIANALGFAWCGGTRSPRVGEDFEFNREEEEGGKVVYYLSARYNPNDPYASGYRINEGLVMKVSNVRFVIEDSSIKLGKPKVKKLQPLTSQSLQAVNKNNSDGKVTLGFDCITTKTITKTENFKFGEKIGVKTSFKVGVPFIVDGKVETSLDFSAEQGWSNTVSNVESKRSTVTYTATVSPNSKKEVYLDVLRKQCDVPYEAKIYMEYDIEFTGFLRYTGNARMDHTQNRPTVSFKFGGKNGMSAVEHLKDLYTHKNIKGYSQWDWNWVDKNYGWCFSNAYNNLSNKYFGGLISGVFNDVDGSKAVVREGKEKQLKKSKGRSKRSTDENIEIENLKENKIEGFKVNKVTYNS